MLTILCGDALELLRTLPDESVQCCVTSPPYDNLRTYGGHCWDFKGIAQELYRVICPGGVICWNVGDSVVVVKRWRHRSGSDGWQWDDGPSRD